MILCLPVMNILWKIIAGERMEYGNYKLQEYLQMLKGSINRISQPLNIMKIIFPTITKMLKLNSDWNEKENIMAVLNNVIEKHRKTFDVENPRDFTDQLIINELQKKTVIFPKWIFFVKSVLWYIQPKGIFCV